MICSIEGIVQQAITNAQDKKAFEAFQLRDLIGQECFNSLNSTEQQFIAEKFKLLVLQNQVLGVGINQQSKDCDVYDIIYKKQY
ncbi:hypothetical protein J3T65_00275 [Staphylococcus simiae]|uniref:hypothetical protein n=1 Tax=Staphylococcus simiae TaxID=308354 RepID=UPI001A969754|nr:hypothetical protein [Staphylococcus simiae]MBO1197899.1 hypothetical protein [Staphylococcus simiae]MBO1200090.1 hypothetical protein [Staphylococcus simiae]MBO1202363.1 hypothetical protein [Staphylococcus simiae]MBO1209890.1 hypothetical protein [Staphylococcus simiae]MBO1228507.1 hypothetical protein [Staphylococcus simiae]